MDDIRDKVDYVLKARQSRNHECHWPGCTKQVAPAMWGCKEHWFMLPHEIRVRIWASYRIGQEERGNPSDVYLEVARQAQLWIKGNYPNG